MKVQTYTLADFMPGGRAILCPNCRAEMDVSTSIDGTRNKVVLRCPDGHVRDFDWPIGSAPPADAIALLSGSATR